MPRARQIVKQEQPICHLTKEQWFGELAATSNALRNATVRASMPDAGGDLAVALYGNEKPNLRLLKMSQQSFVAVCERDGGSTGETMEALRTRRIREVLGSIEELRDIPDKLLNSLVKVMRPVRFDADGEYICAQGLASSSFYIICEGHATVTVNDKDAGPNGERFVRDLGEYDYFGEGALFSRDSKPAANVIATAGLLCMVIDADSFHEYVGDADGDFQKHWRHKEVVKEDPRVQKALRLQRPRQILIHIAHRLRVAQNEDLYDTLHKYLFDHATSLRSGGAAVLAAFIQFPSVAGFRKRLAASVESACSRPWFQRSYSDMALVNMLTMHVGIRHGLRAQFCRQWPDHQVGELCRRFGYKRVRAGSTVFNKSTDGSCAYMVISGMVRLLDVKVTIHADGSVTETNQAAKMDIMPGQSFGMSALTPHIEALKAAVDSDTKHEPRTIQIIRETTAFAVSDVQLFVLEGFDYVQIAALDKDTEVPAEQLASYLRGLSLFAGWDTLRLYQLATSFEVIHVDRGTSMLRPGEVSKALFFIYDGEVEIRTGSEITSADDGHRSQPTTTLSTLTSGEYFGESGLLSMLASGSRRVRELNEVVVSSFAGATLLVLRPGEYRLIGSPTFAIIQKNRDIRSMWREWRGERLGRRDSHADAGSPTCTRNTFAAGAATGRGQASLPAFYGAASPQAALANAHDAVDKALKVARINMLASMGDADPTPQVDCSSLMRRLETPKLPDIAKPRIETSSAKGALAVHAESAEPVVCRNSGGCVPRQRKVKFDYSQIDHRGSTNNPASALCRRSEEGRPKQRRVKSRGHKTPLGMRVISSGDDDASAASSVNDSTYSFVTMDSSTDGEQQWW